MACHRVGLGWDCLKFNVSDVQNFDHRLLKTIQRNIRSQWHLSIVQNFCNENYVSYLIQFVVSSDPFMR